MFKISLFPELLSFILFYKVLQLSKHNIDFPLKIFRVFKNKTLNETIFFKLKTQLMQCCAFDSLVTTDIPKGLLRPVTVVKNP